MNRGRYRLQGARGAYRGGLLRETSPCFENTRCGGGHFLRCGKPPGHRRRNSWPRNSGRRLVGRLVSGVASVVRQYTVLGRGGLAEVHDGLSQHRQ